MEVENCLRELVLINLGLRTVCLNHYLVVCSVGCEGGRWSDEIRSDQLDQGVFAMTHFMEEVGRL